MSDGRTTDSSDREKMVALEREMRDKFLDVTRTLATMEEKLATLSEKSEKIGQIDVLTIKIDYLAQICEKMVSKVEFQPVKLVAYSMMGAVGMTVLGALLSKVVLR